MADLSLKLAVVFPGQGAQFPGMGQDMAAHDPESQAYFQRATAALGYDMAELCFSGTAEALQITENTQPAILTTSMAIYAPLKAALEKRGIACTAFAGLSLGEYGAWIAAGALEFDQAVQVVRNRGKFMQEAVPLGAGGMAAILGLDKELVEKACDEVAQETKAAGGVVEPANYNCPGQLVIAGTKDAVALAVERCKAYGAKKAVMLPVSAPFHTSLLVPAGDQLKPELEACRVHPLQVPVVTNVDGAWNTDSSVLTDKLIRQVSHPVRWETCVETLVAHGVTHIIEVGPGNALSKFIKKIAKEVVVYNVDSPESLSATLQALEEAGYGI